MIITKPINLDSTSFVTSQVPRVALYLSEVGYCFLYKLDTTTVVS
jgi:hypothetical protein